MAVVDECDAQKESALRNSLALVGKSVHKLSNWRTEVVVSVYPVDRVIRGANKANTWVGDTGIGTWIDYSH